MSDPTAGAVAERASRLAREGDFAAAEKEVRAGLAGRPDDEALILLLVDIFRAQRRYPDAAEVLEPALARRPEAAALRLRLAEVQTARGEGQAALDLLAPLEASRARDPRLHHAQAGAWRALGHPGRAVAAMERALDLDPRDAGAWLRREMLASEAGDLVDALAATERALAILPTHPKLMERRAALLARMGRREEAEQALEAVLASDPAAAWAHVQLGKLLQEVDRVRSNHHLRQATRLAPDDVETALALAISLQLTAGPEEGERLDEAARLILSVLPRLPMTASATASAILWQAGFHADVERLGTFSELGRYWAQNGAPAALLQLFARVESDADRLELMHDHRLWASQVEAAAARQPIARPPRGPRELLRLGFLSSDLRGHVVAHFTQPLFEHRDPRFELYCYSGYPGPPDAPERWIASRSAAYRRLPSLDRDAAEVIAGDGLDMLIELGGLTRHSRPEIMAWRPAPVQASWLGYVHSLGMQAIDHIIVDARLAPPRPELLAETPLVLPGAWLTLGRAAFPDSHLIDPVRPAERKGHITFGTANATYKWNPRLIRTWARVVAAVPGSRFMVVRRESGSQAFRENVTRYFAEAGVGDRVDFPPMPHGHWTLYNEIDIALDSFPQTGGTTTCEALWMGVPTVSLVGPAFFERLSYSLLGSAGLEDLVADTVDGYVDKAVALAADADRLADLRRTLRQRLASSPLGQPEGFARDFYELIAQAL